MPNLLDKEKLSIEAQEAELEVIGFLGGFAPWARWTVIIGAIMIIPIFFVAKYATIGIYSNSLKQGEVAAHPSTFNPLSLKVLVDPTMIQISDHVYAVYAQVKNQNVDLVGSQLNYAFHFYDQGNSEILADTSKTAGTTYILAGEQKYLVASNIHLPQTPFKVTLETKVPNWAKRINLPNIVLKDLAHTFGNEDAPAGFYIHGSFQNIGSYTLKTVRISAVVRDASGNIVAVSSTQANTVAPNEVRSYTLYWPQQLTQNLSANAATIQLETNLLDQSNLQ